MTTRKATETIRLEPHVKQRLTDVGRKSETYSDIVERLIDRRAAEIPGGLTLTEETRAHVRTLAKTLDLDETYEEVARLCLRLLTGLGVALGYSGEDLLSDSLTPTQRGNLRTFLNGNPKASRALLAVGGLQGLVKEDGLAALQPHLDAVLRILSDSFNNR